MGLSLTDIGNIATLGTVDFGPPKPPPSPDYMGLAEQTSEDQRQRDYEALLAGRPDEYTPYGARTWTEIPGAEGDPSRWRSDISLTPEGQSLFDVGLQTQQRMGEMGLAGLEAAAPVFEERYQTGLDPLADYGAQRQSVMDAMLARGTEQVGQDRATKEAQLIASGIPKGSEAHRREMERFDRQLTDMRQQAEIASTQQAGEMSRQEMDRRRQSITEGLTERQTPLSELSAFRTGSQVSTPQFQAYSQPAPSPGTDYLGAAGMQSQYDLAGYNADVAAQNAMMEGLFRIGGAAMGGGA
jgi:hypothetical protein